MFIYVINIRRIINTLKILSVILIMVTLFGIVSALIDKHAVSTAVSTEAGRVIIIDAGHGGEDAGAIGINGVYEKDLNLAIALEVGEDLIKRGYTVIYTRTEDKMLYLPEENIKGMRKISDLKNRCKLTTAYEDCILISIHMNSFGSSKYSGLQVYYADGNEDSRILATKIQNSVRKDLQPENKRQVKNGKSLYLLENSSGTPIIIECGFLSNEEECEKLSQKEYQKQLSFSIICGIIEYINEIDGVA